MMDALTVLPQGSGVAGVTRGQRHRIPRQSGIGFVLHAGERLRVIDPCGEQVSDLYVVDRGDLSRHLSSGRSMDYAGRYLLSKGDTLWSNDSEPLMDICEDSVGRHDFLLTPCSQRMFEILYDHRGHHPSCFENLSRALAPFGVDPATIGTTFNIFMNVQAAADGRLSVETPLTQPGDSIVFEARRDLVCGLTACSAEGSNNGALKPIDFIVERS